MDDFSGGKDSVLEMYLFESNQLLEQLEEIMLDTENSRELSTDNINEIFRIMHTIKGSAAMMSFTSISKTAHSVEDLFYFIRENKPEPLDVSAVCDLVLSASDFIRTETGKVQDGHEPDGDCGPVSRQIHDYLGRISGENGGEKTRDGGAAAPAAPKAPDAAKPDAPAGRSADVRRYIAKLHFDDESQMENIRAFAVYNNLVKLVTEIYTDPKDVLNCKSEDIMINGFTLFFATEKSESEIRPVFEESIYLKSYDLEQVKSYEDELVRLHLIETKEKPAREAEKQAAATEQPPREKNGGAADAEKNRAINDTLQKSSKMSLISVNVNKLDVLMDLVGELVISESMVTKNPDLKNLKLEKFDKAARQLRKLTDELQDIVMSIRMIPIAGTFQKMHRIVRDMGKKLGKEVNFVTEGEDTEVDKNIIDHLSDPLMHLIRNSMDHGIEKEEDRVKAGKPPVGMVKLSAKNTGGEIVISVSDDGSGLDKEKILKKARENGLITKPDDEVTEKEIYSCIMQPGFSTNDRVTEFSGRGVGMDVVKKNIEDVGGNVSVESAEGRGTTISIIIPLTLAIADAMEISVGGSVYTLPMVSIMESFRPQAKDIIHDESGNEMIMIRGNCYPIIRLHMLFNQHTEITKLEDGILIMIEGDGKSACIFVDKLIGEQQVVVKPLPQYLFQYSLKEIGVEGCTILGDGSISLILGAKNLINHFI